MRDVAWLGASPGRWWPWIRGCAPAMPTVTGWLPSFQQQVGTGRLSVDEFAVRAAAAFAARSLGVLDALTRDLPRRVAGLARRARPAAVEVLMVVVLALLLAGAMLVLAGMGGAGSMGHMMRHMGDMGHMGQMMGP